MLLFVDSKVLLKVPKVLKLVVIYRPNVACFI